MTYLVRLNTYGVTAKRPTPEPSGEVSSLNNEETDRVTFLATFEALWPIFWEFSGKSLTIYYFLH